MSAANQDFDITEGATRTLAVPLTADGAPYAVPGGSTINWWASPSQFDDAGAVPIKKSTSSGISVTTVSGQSTMLVSIQAGDTVGRGQKKLHHEARLTRADGVVVPLFSGTMTVLKRLVV